MKTERRLFSRAPKGSASAALPVTGRASLRGAAKHEVRRGVIFYVTLIVVLMAGILAAGLNFSVRSQIAGDMVDRQSTQALHAAESGVALAAAVLLNPTRTDEPLDDNPDLFRDVVVVDGPIDWRFSLVRDRGEGDGDRDAKPAFGITDESGRLNLNTASAEQLMMLPGMTAEIADAIVDWRDRDDEPRPLGAESEYYEQLAHPYSAKNGLFESVDELLLVRGVTEQLLYGEDLNRNGLLDGNENDGEKTLPPDNSDGKLDRGWFSYLTVYSVEWGTTRDGSRPININSGSGRQIANEMRQRGFSDELANFVQQARDGNVRFSHPAQLLGWEGEVTSRGRKQTITSPLTPTELPLVLDQLSTSRSRFSLGKVNPAAASKPVLLAVGFTDAEAETVISQRRDLTPQETVSCAWLISLGILSAERFVELAPRLSGRGSQYRIEAIGYSHQLGLFRRIETVLDVGRGGMRTMYYRDLTGLGPAYRMDDESMTGTSMTSGR